MFGNFLYFIVVLLIYLTYQPSEETNFSGFETITLFIGFIYFADSKNELPAATSRNSILFFIPF
jgi:hypothetical protein